LAHSLKSQRVDFFIDAIKLWQETENLLSVFKMQPAAIPHLSLLAMPFLETKLAKKPKMVMV